MSQDQLHDQITLIALHGEGAGQVRFPGADPIAVEEQSDDQARRELLRLCVQRAQMLGQPLMVEASEPSGEASRLWVGVDGSISLADDQAADGTAAGARRPDSARPGRPAAPQRRLVLSRPLGLARRARRSTKILAAVGLALLVTIAVTTALLLRGGGSPAPMITGGTLPVKPPLEWSAAATWHTPALLEDSGRVLVVDGDLVAVVTQDRRVNLVEAATGKTRWSASYPDGKAMTDVSLTTIEGRRKVAVQVAQRLAWWDLETGETGRGTDVPAGMVVSLVGEAPLAVSGDGASAAAMTGTQLNALTLPAGAKAWAAHADGHVLVTSPAGWWHLKPGQQPGPATAWEIPGPAGTPAPTPVAYLGGHLITVLPAPTADMRRIVVYSDAPGPGYGKGVRYSWAGGAYLSAGDVRWTPSPSRVWGILGRTLIDLRRDVTTDLGAWTTAAVCSDRAEGRLDGKRVLTLERSPEEIGRAHV